MDISSQQLRKKARSKVAIGIVTLFFLFFLSVTVMPLGLIILFGGFIGVSIYVYSSIGNIRCPKCQKSFGVGMDFLGNIKIPSKCICCGSKAS